MGWREFCAHLKEMNRQQEARKTNPDSWANADQDPWWQEARAKRDRENRPQGF